VAPGSRISPGAAARRGLGPADLAARRLVAAARPRVGGLARNLGSEEEVPGGGIADAGHEREPRPDLGPRSAPPVVVRFARILPDERLMLARSKKQSANMQAR